MRTRSFAKGCEEVVEEVRAENEEDGNEDILGNFAVVFELVRQFVRPNTGTNAALVNQDLEQLLVTAFSESRVSFLHSDVLH